MSRQRVYVFSLHFTPLVFKYSKYFFAITIMVANTQHALARDDVKTSLQRTVSTTIVQGSACLAGEGFFNYEPFRANAEAEHLAMNLTGQLRAPDTEYDRILVDLQLIRNSNSDLVDVINRGTYSANTMLVRLNSAGSHPAYNALNTFYQVIDFHAYTYVSNLFKLTFCDNLNTPVLIDEYNLLSEVMYAEPNWIIGDGSSVSVEQIGTTYQYQFFKGWGDCMSGCICGQDWTYEVDESGSITLISTQMYGGCSCGFCDTENPIQHENVMHEDLQLIPPNSGYNNYFARSMEMSGSRMVVGSYGADDACPENVNCNSGAAYVMYCDNNNTPANLSDDTYTIEARLTSSIMTAQDYFGEDVSISGDWVVAGARFYDYPSPRVTSIGSAYVFRRDDFGTPDDRADDTWIETSQFLASDYAFQDYFGSSVAIQNDWILIGAPGHLSGTVYVYRRDDADTPSDLSDDVWIEHTNLTIAGGNAYTSFGTAISMKDDRAAISTPDSVYLFFHDDNNTPSDLSDDLWFEEVQLYAMDYATSIRFGRNIAFDGVHLAVGVPDEDDACPEFSDCNSGAVYIFRLNDNSTPADMSDDQWFLEDRLVASDGAYDDRFGQSVSIHGEQLSIGASSDIDGVDYVGSVYVFQLQDNNTPATIFDDFWTEEVKLVASDPNQIRHLGRSVLIRNDTVYAYANLRNAVYPDPNEKLYIFGMNQTIETVVNIPAVSDWGLIVTTLLLLTIASILIRNRQQKTS